MNLKKIIILYVFLLILLIIFFFLIKPFITGKTIQSNPELEIFTYTKAICNKSNFCQDHIITCKKNTLINSKPITGAVIQHSNNWQDPRNKTELCE